ncbi:ABC transporter ATP-binding protein [Methylobacterium aquaticum]|uniref:ABC transporter ATP-binding protein n=1 Tax=Methylobacterium aquaticum TaxID=270351 RepID=UPI003D174220
MNPHLLRVDDLTKHFRTPGGTVHALDGVTLEIAPGETLGLVGESGCGKSTLGKTLVRLYEPDSGHIELLGRDIAHLGPGALRPLRREIQMIFQDPFASLNPRAAVGRILEEPMIVHRTHGRAERRARVSWLMERVGLRPEHAGRLPHEFSGGQRQRIGIARALALSPKLIVCDEPVSALDVSVRAQVINLLADLRDAFGLAYLFISHDLGVVRHVADRIAVMYLGRLVETGPAADIWSRPRHPYTQALLSAVPQVRTEHRRPRVALVGDLPSPLAPPSGCRFRTRCPRATTLCAEAAPAMLAVASRHLAACHHLDAPAAPHAGTASSTVLSEAS